MDLHCLQMCVRIYLMSEFTRLYPILLQENMMVVLKEVA